MKRANPTSSYLSCPTCRRSVRATQVRVRRHRGAVICYVLVLVVGFLAGAMALRLGLLDGPSATRSAGVVAGLAMTPLIVAGWRLPWVLVVRCPACRLPQRLSLKSGRRGTWAGDTADLVLPRCRRRP